MKKLFLVALCFGFFLTAGSVSASPLNENKANNNPNVVSYHPEGTHTVIQPDNSIKYGQAGADLVQQAGSNFQQFYEDEAGNRVHTLFLNVGSDTTCPDSMLFLENPYQPPNGDTWGYHFPDGDNYCASSNFQVNNR